jgi:hypothetical protein
MDESRIRNRALKNLLTSTPVVLPAVLGIGSLLVGLLTGNPAGTFGVLGMAGLALGVGVATWRWLTGSERLTQEALEQLQSGAEREHRSYLRQLQRRLRKDKDPRTNEVVKQLKALRSRLTRVGLIGRRRISETAAEIRDDARQLYRSCLTSLERTLDHQQAAGEMTTPELRQKLLSAREELISQIGESIVRLGATLDHLQTSALEPGRQSEELTRMRRELQTGLEVARRVEQRMDQIDRDLGPQRREGI